MRETLLVPTLGNAAALMQSRPTLPPTHDYHMKKRSLGRDGPRVSEIGLGCWNFTGAYGPTDEAESQATLKTAIDEGVTFLDTANVYGMGLSEEIIGRFIKDNPGRFTVHTKGGLYRNPETKERWFRNEADYLREELEKSLKRLGVEQVQLYYIHRRQPEIDIEDVMETLLRFRQEGKIEAIGFSEIAPCSLRRATACGPVAAVQNEYSLWSRYPDLGMVQACQEMGTAFVAFSPMGRGIFAQKTPDPTTFTKIDFRCESPRFVEPNFSANVAKVAEFKALAADMGTTSPALAMAWVLARGEHILSIPGTRSSNHLRELTSGVALNLTDADLAVIDRILPVGWAHGDRYSRAQWLGAEGYC
jgi:aryl-alcohol dehydrogenase-like predicted oxidoreductase